MPPPPLLLLQDVTIYREERRVLDRLSFSIAQGEHVAIIGPNGCGKSTLIRTINREFYPWLADGPSRLEILGQSTWNVWDLRRMIGLVSNDLTQACSRDATGREIVLSGFFSSIGIQEYHRATPDMHARVDALMHQLHITHLADRWTDELSSGEARRLVLARALVHNPPALLLDEPSNSLDFAAQLHLRDTISKVAQQGKSVIVVTHELMDIVPEIDRVILMKKGKIFADGPKPDLLTSDHLSQLFEVPLTVAEQRGHYSLTS